MLAPLFTRARIALLVVVGDVVGLISLVGGCVVVCAVASEAGAVGGVAGVDERQSADGAGAVSLIPGALAFVKVSAQSAGRGVGVFVGDASSSASGAPGAVGEASSSAGSSDASAAPSASSAGSFGTGWRGSAVLAMVVVVFGFSVLSVFSNPSEGLADPPVVSGEVAGVDVESALVHPITEEFSDVSGGEGDCALPDDSSHCIEEYECLHVAGAHLR